MKKDCLETVIDYLSTRLINQLVLTSHNHNISAIVRRSPSLKMISFKDLKFSLRTYTFENYIQKNGILQRGVLILTQALSNALFDRLHGNDELNPS